MHSRSSLLAVGLMGLTCWAATVTADAQTTQTFNYTGSLQSFQVPTDVTTLSVQLWGAGGASIGGTEGGSGAYVAGNLTVTPGETLDILVGGGGVGTVGGFGGGGSAGPAAAGGGRTAIQLAGVDLVDAAGGGGGINDPGGDGGVTAGKNGSGPTSGGGGTQTEGGSGDSNFPFATGTQYQGGIAPEGGGGGGGYYGGGGGGLESGGGGGSSYVANLTDLIGINGGGGQGGAGGTLNEVMSSSGQNGMLILTYTPATDPAAVPEPSSLALLAGLGIPGGALLLRRRRARKAN